MDPLNIQSTMQQVLSGSSMELMSLQPALTIDTNWDEDMTPTNLNSLEATINCSYPFPPYQLDSAVISDDGMSHQAFAGLFPDSSPRSRYASLDGDRPDITFMLPMLGKTRSLNNDAKEDAKERRRAQNRFAQRAYRQRKEQAMKDQEKEIETLRLQLAKEKKLNQALSRVIEFLKERLKTKQSAPKSTADTEDPSS